MRKAWLALILAALGAHAAVGAAIVTPLEIRQDSATYNIHSVTGVPISTVVGTPAGSDGRSPTQGQQQADGLTINPPTTNQLRGVVQFGASVRPVSSGFSGGSMVANAEPLKLPRAPQFGPQVIMLRAKVGAPYISRQSTILFGDVITPPDTDESGAPLPQGTTPEQYWLSEPYFTGNATNATYYYSPHANKVFATQAGPIDITWRKAIPFTSEPADYGSNPEKYFKSGSNYYPLYNVRYVISSSPVKNPRRIYWTEGSFARLGRVVEIPETRVSVVNFVYNSAFPERVASEIEELGDSSILGTNSLPETRTIWWEYGGIRSLNKEGRVFMELLGDSTTLGNRVHLGFELVDVRRSPSPVDIEIELGERINAFADARDDSELLPDPIAGDTSHLDLYQGANGDADYFAIAETFNLNDVLIHWLETGEQGVLWPARFGRYDLVWPDDISKYSHYVRPEVGGPTEAKLTSVKLPFDNSPQLMYQESLDFIQRAYVVDATLEFYTFLDSTQPIHRSLIRYHNDSTVHYERVVSWLDRALKDQSLLTNSSATNFTAYNAASNTFNFSPALQSPRYVQADVYVGDRILPPSGELGHLDDDPVLVGHIRTNAGNLFNPLAYQDPYQAGFTNANLGAIIPVNAHPTNHNLEVHWFRAGSAKESDGFDQTFWPSIIGRYTIKWPLNPHEIVLASNDGSGGLPSLVAKGSVYGQNDRAIPGYNPNEEHGIMLGGQAFALRDDLNIVSTNGFTSERYVLVSYTEADGRPAMHAFKVLREKPEAGISFVYEPIAGQVLQAPMPLPLLPKPIPSGQEVSLNRPVPISEVSANAHHTAATNVTLTMAQTHSLLTNRVYIVQHASDVLQRRWFLPTSANYPARTVTGVISSTNAAAISWVSNDVSSAVFTADWLSTNLAANSNVVLFSEEFSQSVWATISSIDGTNITISGASLNVLSNMNALLHPDYFNSSESFNGWKIRQEPRRYYNTDENLFTLKDRKNDVWVYRGPHEAHQRGGFEMQFFYPTQPGFHFPSESTQPAPGILTPYLRVKLADGSYLGDAVEVNTNQLNSLPIAYRPVWPADVPELFMAESLMTPKRGLPAVRGQTSLRLVYQQSLAADEASQRSVSVVLHDPTREKEFFLVEDTDNATKLAGIPASAMIEDYQGKTYFPLLPPHLGERFFFDINRGAYGALVLRGEFVDEALGEDYLHLNVLGLSDLEFLNGLVDSNDEDFAKWTNAIAGLSTTLELFVENPDVPGTYIADTNQNRTIGATNLSETFHFYTKAMSDDVAVDSYALSAVGPGTGYVSMIAGDGRAFTPEDEPVSVLVLKVNPDLHRGEVKVVQSSNPLSEKITFQQVVDLAARTENYVFEWRYAQPVDGQPPTVTVTNADPGAAWLVLESAAFPEGVRANWGGSANVKTLADNYLIMRYGQKDVLDEDGDNDTDEVIKYSYWTTPQLAEGWIKRVLAGINPFAQRVTDLFNNQVDTDVSLVAQAGTRWEGDVALNLENINNYGLIEIYETVLRRGRGLSIDAGINFGPANDALLLAAGYLNDLYMLLGNEARADAVNPTIGIGTADQQLGDIATALFSFKGQVATLLDEELALLRGRDDFLVPGVEVAPVYNRLVWNYTRGIDSGEIVYALNYNIQEDPTKDSDGVINADDARYLYPQAHGDAYGHYLTALKNYYSLIMDTDFDWVPRIEAVLVLGQPVSVDYLDERKFASAALAVARTGKEVFDLTWRNDFDSAEDAGWEHFGQTRSNTNRLVATTRHWGMDHWATRTGQGAYLNWVVGNAMLPDVDPDPSHEGIQKVDRTTVPELLELTTIADSLQTDMSNAEGGLNPLGFPKSAIPFDLDPSALTQASESHFEQIYARARRALKNAIVAFDEAKDITRLMRSEENSLDTLRNNIAAEESAFEGALVEIYGTPYPDDIGPGRTYSTGYEGPDLLNYLMVETPEISVNGLIEPANDEVFTLDVQGIDAYVAGSSKNFDFYTQGDGVLGVHHMEFQLGSHGFYDKPAEWQSRRVSPGQIQQAISEIIQARHELLAKLDAAAGAKGGLDEALKMFETKVGVKKAIRGIEGTSYALNQAIRIVDSIRDFLDEKAGFIEETEAALAEIKAEGAPKVVGFSNDPSAIMRALAYGKKLIATKVAGIAKIAKARILAAKAFATDTALDALDLSISQIEHDQELREEVEGLAGMYGDVQGAIFDINSAVQPLDDAERNLQALIASGNGIQAEREVARRRAAALVQGYRTRDAAFRTFRNEKLERYNSLFKLAARYAYLAAKAYDYETGLLGTGDGLAFIDRIVASRSLGVVTDGEPQFAGSNTGDPGLSSVLAEMLSDWQVLKGRLGINNPEEYGTTVSLRSEKFRILPGTDGDTKWRDVLEAARTSDLRADPDVRQLAMQIENGSDLPVPGLIIDFSTTIADGYNLFGNKLAPGDHNFSATLFATKIFGAGVVFDGYTGMDSPGASGTGTADPDISFLDPNALAATPAIYLIPAGADSMRSPPLGDQSVIRTWNVEDVTVPLPFNVGGSDFSTKKLFQAGDTLTEPLYAVRKHPAFRPVASASVFEQNLVGGLQRSEFTSSRLIGRSVWNSRWKLVIPGRNLLHDPEEGLDRFIRTVKDIKLRFETYSYSGN